MKSTWLRRLGHCLAVSSLALTFSGCVLDLSSHGRRSNGGSGGNTTVNALTCTATSALAAGVQFAANGSVTLSSITVSISGTNSDTFQVTFPDGGTLST